jgi:segregation and condensation protein A
MTVEVNTPVFSGPFDLLLHLITGNQVEIYDISISNIVEAYLRELEKMPEVDLETATEFLVIAATLIELKSARLLPGEGGEELGIDIELGERRDYLIAKLLENKMYKGVAERLRSMMEESGRRYPHPGGADPRFVKVLPPLLERVSPVDLAKLAASALAKATQVPERPELSHIYVAPIRFAEVFEQVVERVQDARQISFRDLTSACSTRLEVGLHFLAILELYKRELVDIEQFRTFGEITVHWLGPSDPTKMDLLEWEEEGDDSAEPSVSSQSAGPANSAG